MEFLQAKYDPTVDAIYISIRPIGKGEAARQVIVKDTPGVAEVILDYSRKGELIGVEVLNASDCLSREFLDASRAVE